MKTRYDTYHRSIASLGRQSADLTEARDRARPVRTDPHAPSEERGNIVRNLDPWYQAFGVQPGQKLYLDPAGRVRIW